MTKWNWFGRWHVFYFLVRYFPLLSELSLLLDGTAFAQELHVSPHACIAMEIWQSAVTAITVAAVDLVFVFRVRALYHDSIWVHRALPIVWAVYVTVMIICIGITVAENPLDAVCYAYHIPKILLFYGLVGTSLQLILFILTSIKYKTMRRRWRDVTLMHLLMRDGTWAVTLILVVLLFQGLVILVYNDGRLNSLFLLWIISLFSFCGYRVLLNLRAFALAEQRSHRFSSSDTRSGAVTDPDVQISTVPEFSISRLPSQQRLEVSASSHPNLGGRIALTLSKLIQVEEIHEMNRREPT